MEINLNIYYVGQANFTIIIRNEKTIIYDCGTMDLLRWTFRNNLRSNVKKYLKEILKNVKEILLIISHNDEDHYNLLKCLTVFFIECKKNYVVIKNNCIETLKDPKNISYNEEIITKEKINSFENFFNSNTNSESKIAVKLYLSFTESKNENRKSIIMKISGKFINGKFYSLLFTGDANGDTINDIIKEYDIIKESPTEENSPNNSSNDNPIKAFFTDIIFHMNPHHGVITDNSFLWSNYSIQYSSYPVLNII